MIAVPSIDAALGPELFDAERMLAAYSEAFTRTYGPPASAMVPVSCVCDGETLSSANVLEQAARDDNVLLIGE